MLISQFLIEEECGVSINSKKKRDRKKIVNFKLKNKLLSPATSEERINFFMLDTNLFRKACKSIGGKYISNLNKCLDANAYLKNEKITAFKITPFSLLEFLGIVAPNPGDIDISLYLRSKTDIKEIASYIVRESKQFFIENPMLQLENLRLKAEEQKQYVEPEAMDLFEICVLHPLASDGIVNTIATFLSFDYLYKYQFSPALEQEMHAYFSVHFFLDGDFSGSLSKFRFSKRLWDRSLSSLEKISSNNSENSVDLKRIGNSMKIKNKRDFLDGDLVHYVAFGYVHKGKRAKVVALTCDAAEVVADRVAVHRSIGKAIFENCEQTVKDRFRSAAMHRGGFVVTCDDEGMFSRVISIAEYPQIF
jgi:hypothetical protein